MTVARQPKEELHTEIRTDSPFLLEIHRESMYDNHPQPHENTERTMPNLVELIEQNAAVNLEDIKDVPPIPVGNYLAQIVGNYEMTQSNRKQTDGTQFPLRLLQPRDDVDRASLDAYLTAANVNLADVTLRHTIWDSPYALPQLRDFLRAAGCEGELKYALSNIPGKQLVVTITHRIADSNDGTKRLMAQISGVARAS